MRRKKGRAFAHLWKDDGTPVLPAFVRRLGRSAKDVMPFEQAVPSRRRLRAQRLVMKQLRPRADETRLTLLHSALPRRMEEGRLGGLCTLSGVA